MLTVLIKRKSNPTWKPALDIDQGNLRLYKSENKIWDRPDLSGGQAIDRFDFISNDFSP